MTSATRTAYAGVTLLGLMLAGTIDLAVAQNAASYLVSGRTLRLITRMGPVPAPTSCRGSSARNSRNA